MQLLNKLLNEHIYKGILGYLDDILIYSETMDVQLVQQVLKKTVEC